MNTKLIKLNWKVNHVSTSEYFEMEWAEIQLRPWLDIAGFTRYQIFTSILREVCLSEEQLLMQTFNSPEGGGWHPPNFSNWEPRNTFDEKCKNRILKTTSTKIIRQKNWKWSSWAVGNKSEFIDSLGSYSNRVITRINEEGTQIT